MLRIAQVAPLYESVPPKLYGGTERVVAYLTDELVKLGHEVTLFASGDSVTKAKLIAIHPESLRMSKNLTDPLAHHILQLQEVMDRKNEFDILHFHTDYLHYPLTRHENIPSITTLHGRLDIPELFTLYKKFNDIPVISISNSQRTPLPMANWAATVYHGLPENLYQCGKGNGGYVAFIGRISPEKGIDKAIEIACRANMPIKIAAKIDKVDVDYFEKEIRHLFDLPHVEYIGEIGDKDKGEFLGNASALLFPINWPEPFGMAMMEAMACGTPVIAFNRGSVPEIIEPGKNGFIANTVEEAVDALNNIAAISREQCRLCFEKNFTATRMANDYVSVYKKIISAKKTNHLPDTDGALNYVLKKVKAAILA